MKSIDDNRKIAIDVKTTYRKYSILGSLAKFGYTLGSFASFMRNDTKNIMYPYSQYESHYVIGFLYNREKKASEGEIYKMDEISSIITPYKNIEIFIQEKYKIAGEKPGSGNTENMGSFLTNDISKLEKGCGPFASLGEDTFHDYWTNYPKYRAPEKPYTNLEEYFDWKERDNVDCRLLRDVFKQWKNDYAE